MARLYDRVLAGEWEVPAWCPELQDAELSKLYETIADSTVIVADEVAQYYFEVDDNPAPAVSEDFPNVAPPLNPMWIEYRPTHVVNRGGNMVQEDHHLKKVGFLLDSARSESGCWTIRAYAFSRILRTVTGLYANVLIGANPDGSYRAAKNVHMPDGSKGVPAEVPYSDRLDPSVAQLLVQGAIDSIKPVLLTLSFMHCKNVERRTVDQPAPLSKKWEKKHGRPLVRYEVLDIDPMKKTLESEGGASTNGLKKALHICRGHFATYTEDAPLFGKITGTFWKPQHVRGSAKSGAVVKDYNVEAP